MSPLNAAICTTISYTLIYELNDTIQKAIIWPWGQSPTKVITVRDTLPYGHAPTYQISLTYLKRQKCYGPDKKILFKKSRKHQRCNGRVASQNHSSGPRIIPHPLPEVNFLMVEIPTPKPYIFMTRVTRQIKCIIAQAPGSYFTPYLKWTF
jgi:hypothetical protein